MMLRLIRDSWDVESGREHRLWWRDCPGSEAFMRLPTPDEKVSYDINITEIYNLWAQGAFENHGIMLEPEQIGAWKRGSEEYGSLNQFYSTRAAEPEKRPKLILHY
jgi:hypothetical protein